MRVLQLISSAGYYGAENMLVTLAAELNTLGIPSVVGAFTHGQEPEILTRARARHLPTAAFPCNGRIDFKLPSRLAAYVRREGITHIHTHGYKANLYTQAARSGASQVATCHNWAVRSGSLGLYSVLDRYALTRVPAVVAVSENVARRLIEYDIVSPQLHTVSNGIEISRFASATPTLELAPRPAKLLGCVSRLTAGKGLDILLTAFSMLPERHHDAHLALIGSGELDAALRAQADRLLLTGRVHFTGARADMPGVYASLDRFILPSLDEGLPMSVLEAMAARVPVLATTVGAIPRLLQGDGGWLLPPNNAAALAEAITESLDQPALARQRATNAAQTVEAQYSSTAMARGYLEIYEAVLSRNRSGRNSGAPASR